MHLCRAWFPAVCFFAAGAAAAEPTPAREFIATLDFFGVRHLDEAELRAKLALHEGDGLQRERAQAAVRELERVPGVAKATLSQITTDGSGGIHLFVGIQEDGATGFGYRAVPEGPQRLPEPLMKVYVDCMQALGPAVRNHRAREDDSAGHALNDDPDMRRAQDEAIALMQTNLPAVREVLQSSARAEERRAAAWLLGYAADKRVVTGDLSAAAKDPDSTVRNNATRALGAIAVLAAAQPRLGIEIDPAVFIEMLQSVTWTDRNKGLFVLNGLTRQRPEILPVLRARVLPELVEMARWKSKGHAGSAVVLLGRIAGWRDERSRQAWADGRVEDVVAAATSAAASR